MRRNDLYLFIVLITTATITLWWNGAYVDVDCAAINFVCILCVSCVNAGHCCGNKTTKIIANEN